MVNESSQMRIVRGPCALGRAAAAPTRWPERVRALAMRSGTLRIGTTSPAPRIVTPATLSILLQVVAERLDDDLLLADERVDDEAHAVPRVADGRDRDLRRLAVGSAGTPRMSERRTSGIVRRWRRMTSRPSTLMISPGSTRSVSSIEPVGSAKIWPPTRSMSARMIASVSGIVSRNVVPLPELGLARRASP